MSPSSLNNLVGIKPTVKLTSRSLVTPISERQDTVSPTARSVSDAAYLLSIITSKDGNDNHTLVWNTMLISNKMKIVTGSYSLFGGKVPYDTTLARRVV
ncbi:hypothetical protein L207DRAFT_590271 [Hyaloscypha variabilis F]|uniref:Amidase domain-containing protein n=1 Tax=Hyaloscypha variabilis (strain UAMH 11265 / GT02V1 / F) TaxID=1149755 RepID=A0A2J6R239_HYAVF|nr:hypothetical protein L207DRAFT_590271 [Hyaloscypha variabilis F]